MEMTLETFLDKFKPLKENLIVHIVKEIVKGLEVIHNNNRIHRDIKPGNIFIDIQGRVKIGDFGEIGESFEDRSLKRSILGTPLYMAPEILQGVEYSYLADIWSLGILIAELAGSPLYKSKCLGDLLEDVNSGKNVMISSQYTKKFSNLLESCLQRNYCVRPNARQLINTKILREARNKRESIKKKINSDYFK